MSDFLLQDDPRRRRGGHRRWPRTTTDPEKPFEAGNLHRTDLHQNAPRRQLGKATNATKGEPYDEVFPTLGSLQTASVPTSTSAA